MHTKLKSKRKGVIGIADIPRVALLIGVAIFIVALMTQLSGNLRTAQCDGSVGFYNYSFEVCCADVNATGTGCNLISADSTPSFNITTQGIEGLATFGDWWTIMVLSVILIIIIGLLYSLLGGQRGGSQY